jgi:transcriptional regulator with XRE-family HTH domain
MINLGAVLKEEIKRQNKTQKQVAEIVGVSNNSLSQICIGATFPHKETLEKICECLNIEICFYVKNKV